MATPIPTALAQLVELLSAAIGEMESTSMAWERGAIAARWLEFEIAPILAKLDLGCEVDGIAQRAVEAYKRQLAVRAETLSIDSEVPFVGTATLTARPQRQAFHIDRIFIPPEIAPLFLIDDISIGNISQFSQSGALPATVFAQEPPIAFDIINTAQDLRFVVSYVGDDPAGARFRAVAMGEPVTDEQRRISPEQQRELLGAWHSIVGQ